MIKENNKTVKKLHLQLVEFIIWLNTFKGGRGVFR